MAIKFGKLAAAVLAGAMVLGGAVQAQTSEQVQFAPGNYGTMVSGSVTGDAYVDYVLRAGAGQQMFAELTVRSSTGSGVAYFNILPPGSDGAAIYVGSMDGNSALIDLPANGAYKIRVYQMGNDRDAGKTTDFNLDLSIQ